MKKILYLFLGMILLFGSSSLVFALEDDNQGEGNSEVEEDDADQSITNSEDLESDEDNEAVNVRTMFIEQYFAKKTTLENLRIETKIARQTNNELVAQIKSIIKNQERTTIQNKIAEIKDLRLQIKDLITKAKNTITSRDELKKQIREANRNGLDTLNELNAQLDEINGNLSEYKTTLENYRSELKTMVADLKAYRNEEREKYQELKELYKNVKGLHSEILAEEVLKNQKWDEFRIATGDKNYGKAIEAFNAIIEQKTIILALLKNKNTLLQEIIDQYQNA